MIFVVQIRLFVKYFHIFDINKLMFFLYNVKHIVHLCIVKTVTVFLKAKILKKEYLLVQMLDTMCWCSPAG